MLSFNHISNVLANRHTSVVEVRFVQTFSNSYDINILCLRSFLPAFSFILLGLPEIQSQEIVLPLNHISNVLANRHTSVVEVRFVQTFLNSYDINILCLRVFLPGFSFIPQYLPELQSQECITFNPCF